MKLNASQIAERQQRRLEAVTLHEIEGNPFTPDDEAMFAMFDREGWSDAQRRAYIIAQATEHEDAPLAAE